MRINSIIYGITAIAASMLLAVACAENVDITPENQIPDGPYVTLTISTPDAARTKAGADSAGVDALNENKVTSVYYFFYKDGSDTQAPKMSGHFSGLSLSGEDASKTWYLPVSADMIANQLFPSGIRECQTFVVANPPASLVTTLNDQESTITLKALRELTFTSSLTGKQDSFVMVWDGKSEVGSRTGSGSSSMDVIAELKRVANKITINAKVAPEFYDKKGGWIRWEPDMSSLKVEFYNGMSKTNLSGDFSKLTVSDEDYFNSGTSSFGTASSTSSYFYEEVTAAMAGTSYSTLSAVPSPALESSPAFIKVDTMYLKKEQYVQAGSTNPFYSYAMTWEYASATEPFLMFELDWAPHWVDAGGQNHQGAAQTCYYKLMLSQKSITTNGWYDVTADLKVLGSFDKFKPTQQYLHEDYVVLDWINAFASDDNNVNADIKDAKYLVVNQDEYILNNQKTLSIPFISSHPCEIGSITVTKKDFTKTPPSDVVTVTPGSDWVTVNGSVIEFKHDLNNDWDSANLDVSPYYFTITLQHEDDATYSEVITITQYPAVYIEADYNSTAGSNYGHTWVNGARGTGNVWNYVGNTYTGASGVKVPYMTVITVSQLDDDQDYIIGDPRVKSTLGTNGYPTWWDTSAPADAPAQYIGPGDDPDGNGNRTMKYYYEAGGADYEKFIAPKFRLVSGYSYNNGARSYNRNLMRCAAYQEDGYPAGRWRLPTRAEIEFIKKIEAKDLILGLFVTTTKYWSPTAYILGTSFTEDLTTTACSRCVYDEWYWGPIDEAAGNDHSTKTFYWGDQPL